MAKQLGLQYVDEENKVSMKKTSASQPFPLKYRKNNLCFVPDDVNKGRRK